MLWRNPLTGRPLFIRIFALMLTGVILAQVLNFLLLLAVPVPQIQQHMLIGVVESLRTGDAAPGLEVTTDDYAPPNAGPPDRLRANRQWLVDQLGVPSQDVRLELRGPAGRSRGPSWTSLEPTDKGPGPGPGPEPGRRRPPHDDDDDKPSPPPDPRDAHEHVPVGGFEHRDDAIIGDFAAALKLPSGEWRVVQPEGGGLRGWYMQIVFWLLTTIGVVTPLTWWLARWLAGPIAMFATAAERLGRDPGAPALTITNGPPEVRAAATAFNQMQERLRRYVEDRTLMVAAIAHDLRTPLARLAFRLEEAPDAVREAAAEDIAEMREMIAAALSFVKDMSRPVTRSAINIAALVQKQVDASRQMGEPVSTGSIETAWIDGDAAGIARLVDNLIGNAVTYGGSAVVSLQVDEANAIITVEDEGPGIPATLLERVFEPFFRVEPSRNRHTGGTGLGLASARAVARAHGGDVTLSNRPEGGLCARITLPLHQ